LGMGGKVAVWGKRRKEGLQRVTWRVIVECWQCRPLPMVEYN